MDLNVTNFYRPFLSRELQLFQSLDLDNDDRVLRSDVIKTLADVGLRKDDPRLRESLAALRIYEEDAVTPSGEAAPIQIPRDNFCEAIRHNILLIERALQGNMVIPDFAEFCEDITRIHDGSVSNKRGEVASYIPQLDLKGAKADQYGVALCTIDGQRFSVGDSTEFFSVQSVCKPILYGLALEEHGAEKVHQHVGHEPSGASFNELALNKDNRPHNPMINAGAIISSSLIKLSDKQERLLQAGLSEMDLRGWASKRLQYVMEAWQALSGGDRPSFSSTVYLSERQTADRNFALAYFMREKGAFPAGVDLEDVLDFYFQNCSVELNAEMLSVVAATLANGGICPVTGARIFRPDTVQSCLSLMSTCGMYDFSGEFAFKIGLPAKSGVSGAVLIVIPNVMGICTWSPRLDQHGNSVRGIDFCQRLVGTFNFHNYDNITGVSEKRDPRIKGTQQKAKQANEIIWAASRGDLGALQQEVWRGTDLNSADYDFRTPLHLAAAEGQAHVVHFFVEQIWSGESNIELNPRDRWGGTPMDDAQLHGHQDIVEILQENGGIHGRKEFMQTSQVRHHFSEPQVNGAAAVELIWAASIGDLREIRRLVAQGISLDAADYDLRTPLHLAAAEGQIAVVKYLLTQGVDVNPTDRWDYTPLDEARRHGHEAVVSLLQGTEILPNSTPLSGVVG